MKIKSLKYTLHILRIEQFLVLFLASTIISSLCFVFLRIISSTRFVRLSLKLFLAYHVRHINKLSSLQHLVCVIIFYFFIVSFYFTFNVCMCVYIAVIIYIIGKRIPFIRAFFNIFYSYIFILHSILYATYIQPACKNIKTYFLKQEHILYYITHRKRILWDHLSLIISFLSVCKYVHFYFHTQSIKQFINTFYFLFYIHLLN